MSCFCKQTRMHMGNKVDNNTDDKIRLDKWLWAARFYRTRALAKQAVESGKVHYQGTKTVFSSVPWRMVIFACSSTTRLHLVLVP